MSEISEDSLTDKWILQACRDFKLPITSVADNFFMIGATSITLMRLIARAEKELGVTLEPEEILDAESIEDIALLLSTKQAIGEGELHE